MEKLGYGIEIANLDDFSDESRMKAIAAHYGVEWERVLEEFSSPILLTSFLSALTEREDFPLELSANTGDDGSVYLYFPASQDIDIAHADAFLDEFLSEVFGSDFVGFYNFLYRTDN